MKKQSENVLVPRALLRKLIDHTGDCAVWKLKAGVCVGAVVDGPLTDAAHATVLLRRGR